MENETWSTSRDIEKNSGKGAQGERVKNLGLIAQNPIKLIHD